MIVMESVLCIPTVVDNGGDDTVYIDLKNNLYSPVSHITFTHRPRFVDGRLLTILPLTAHFKLPYSLGRVILTMYYFSDFDELLKFANTSYEH